MADCNSLLDLDRLSCRNRSVLEVLYIALAPATVIVNCLLITAMIGTRQALSNTSHVLIMCMSVVNTLSGALSMPLMAVMMSSYTVQGTLSVASQFIGSFFFILSSLIMILMTIDRYLHMRTSLLKRESTFTRLFRGKWIALPLIVCIVCSVLISVASIKLHKFGVAGIIVAMVIMSVLDLMFIPGIAILYIRGYIRVKKFAQQNPVYNDPSPQTEAENSQAARVKSTEFKPVYVRNLQKTVLLLIITLMITHTPLVLSSVMLPVFIIIGKQSNILLIIYDVLTLIYYLHFLLNGLIIFKLNRKARLWLFEKVEDLKCWSVNHDRNTVSLSKCCKSRKQPGAVYVTRTV